MEKRWRTLLIRMLIFGLVMRCNSAGRDNTVLSPVQGCGDGILSGVNTVSCIQNVSAVSTGSTTFKKPLASEKPIRVFIADGPVSRQKEHVINREVKDLITDEAL